MSAEPIKSKRLIPLWIIIYAAIQILTSVVGIYGGYFDPSFFYGAQFPTADYNDLVRHLAGVWGSKNLGIVIVMILAIVQRWPRLLGGLFLMKGIQDTIDILYTNNAFYPEPAILQSIITWLILGLPQFICAYILIQRAGGWQKGV